MLNACAGSLLAHKYQLATNTIAMFLQRRRRSNTDGIYQALGFKNKSNKQ